MLTKLKINLIAILMCVCLTSVGFSAWTITGTSPSVFISGNVTADKVINSTDYIELDKTKGTEGFEIFTFNSEGFISNPGTDDADMSTTGDIAAYYTIHGNECKALFGLDTTSITANFRLGYANASPATPNASYGIFQYISSAKIVIGESTYNMALTYDRVSYANASYNIPLQDGDFTIKVLFTLDSDIVEDVESYEFIYAGLCTGTTYYTFKIDTTLTETGA